MIILKCLPVALDPLMPIFPLTAHVICRGLDY